MSGLISKVEDFCNVIETEMLESYGFAGQRFILQKVIRRIVKIHNVMKLDSRLTLSRVICLDKIVLGK